MWSFHICVCDVSELAFIPSSRAKTAGGGGVCLWGLQSLQKWKTASVTLSLCSKQRLGVLLWSGLAWICLSVHPENQGLFFYRSPVASLDESVYLSVPSVCTLRI